MIYVFNGRQPELRGKGIFIAPGADVIGEVILHSDVSIWFNATVRGDMAPVIIGEGTNVQDGSSVHCDIDIPVEIGNRVTVGHNCVIHSCVIGDGSLIGMGSTILSGARIGKNCLIGGGAVVTGSMDVPDGMLVLGSPAKIIKPLGSAVISKNHENSAEYIRIKNQYLEQGTGHPDSSYL